MKKCTLVPLHVGLSVSDVDASIQWYRDNLGFELTGRERVEHLGAEIATVKNGDFMLELFHYPGSVPLPPERRHPDTDIRAQGTKHLCLCTDDLESLVARLRANGVEIVIGPGTMGEYTFYYIRDNDGILIELMEKNRG